MATVGVFYFIFMILLRLRMGVGWAGIRIWHCMHEHSIRLWMNLSDRSEDPVRLGIEALTYTKH